MVGKAGKTSGRYSGNLWVKGVCCSQPGSQKREGGYVDLLVSKRKALCCANSPS